MNQVSQHETLRSYASVQNWLNKVSAEGTGSEKTQKLYLDRFAMYVEWTGKNPDQLKEERLQHLRDEGEEVNHTEERLVDEYFKWLMEKRGKNRGYAASYVAIVRSFYTANYGKLLSKIPKSPRSLRIKPPLTEDFAKILVHCDPRDRALTLWIKDTGMGRGDVVLLRWKHLKREWGKIPLHIQFVREKTKQAYETFAGEEAVNALKEYFDLRGRRGEKMWVDEMPIFAQEQVPYNPMVEGNISDAFADLEKKSGVEVSSHRLRKYFETYMGLAKVHPFTLKYWMGHVSTGGSDIEARYMIPPTEEQRKLYESGYDKLRILPKTILTTDDVALQSQLEVAKMVLPRVYEKFMEWKARYGQTVTVRGQLDELEKIKADETRGRDYDNHEWFYRQVRFGSDAYTQALIDGFEVFDRGEGDVRILRKAKKR